MGQGPLTHEVLVPLGPEYQPHRPAKCGTEGSHSSDPTRWAGSSCGGPRWVAGQSEAQIWGSPTLLARVPAHTCRHTVIHTCACVYLTNTYSHPIQEDPHPGPYPCPYTQGCPRLIHRATSRPPRLTHTDTCICGYESVVWAFCSLRGGLTHTPDIPSSPSPIPHPQSSHIHRDSHSQPGHTWHTAGKAQTGRGDN